MWKLLCVLAFVCCVLVSALVMLRQQNKTLQEQNKALTVAMDISIKVAADKQKRTNDELQRLVKILQTASELDPTWRSMDIPNDVREFMQQYLDSNSSTISASTTAKGGL